MLLALDTSGPVCSAALLENDTVLYEALLQQSTGHAKTILRLVEQGMEHTGKTPRDIGLLACVVGPGSFTGVRIGVATAKSLCEALGVDCVPVHAFDALAYGHKDFPGIVAPILDARAGQVYAGAYEDGKRIRADEALPLEDFLDALLRYDKRVCFVGDGSYSLRKTVEARMGDKAVFPGFRSLRASDAGLWAVENDIKGINPGDIHAYYLREPQAVRERKESNG